MIKLWQNLIVFLIVVLFEIVLGSIGWTTIMSYVFSVSDFGPKKAILASIASMLIMNPLNAKIDHRKDY